MTACVDDRQAVFDFSAPPVVKGALAPPIARRHRGATSYRAGLAAEAQVAADYTRRGYREVARRWRCAHGEIDLVFSGLDGTIFVEVKRGRTHDSAIEHLRPAQVARLFAAAETYLDGRHQTCRFDVALVDGTGHISVLENAFT